MAMRRLTYLEFDREEGLVVVVGDGGSTKRGPGGSSPQKGKSKYLRFFLKLHVPSAFYTVFRCGLRNVFP